MMKLEHGTLVRVCSPASYTDKKRVTDHGNLWLYIRTVDDGGDGLHECKSLATGEEYPWYTHEFEVPDAEA